MRRIVTSAGWAADYSERQAGQRLQRERDLNRVIEQRNPSIRPTEEYRRTASVSSFSPRFSTREDWIEFQTRREMAKFDPFVRVDRCGSRRRER